MFCAKCGSQQPDGAAACSLCGSSNAAPPSSGGIAEAPLAAPAIPTQPGPPLVGYVVPAPGHSVARPGNPLAVAGFVCGLFGLTPFWIGFLLCILAIIFSAIGMSKSGDRGGAGKGLAIAGLVMGIVFITPAACGL